MGRFEYGNGWFDFSFDFNEDAGDMENDKRAWFSTDARTDSGLRQAQPDKSRFDKIVDSIAQDVEFVETSSPRPSPQEKGAVMDGCSGHECSIKLAGVKCSICKENDDANENS